MCLQWWRHHFAIILLFWTLGGKYKNMKNVVSMIELKYENKHYKQNIFNLPTKKEKEKQWRSDKKLWQKCIFDLVAANVWHWVGTYKQVVYYIKDEFMLWLLYAVTLSYTLTNNTNQKGCHIELWGGHKSSPNQKMNVWCNLLYQLWGSMQLHRISSTLHKQWHHRAYK